MRYFILGVFLLSFFGAGLYQLTKEKTSEDYVGKCYNQADANPFINSIKIKISHELSENKYNVLIHYTKKPETPEEMFMLAKVQQYNDSWISSEQLQSFNEVPCD